MAFDMMGYYGGYGMGFFGFFWMALFWIGIIWFIAWIVRQASQTGRISEKTPVQILKERYAKGEITQKEYESMRKEILDDKRV